MAFRLAYLCPLLAVLAVSCSGVQKRRFEFDVIDADENPRPCLVAIESDFLGAEENKQVVNVDGDDVLALDLAFPSREVNVTVLPLRVVNGKVSKFPRSPRESWDTGFADETRSIRIDDPTRVLFILPRKGPSN